VEINPVLPASATCRSDSFSGDPPASQSNGQSRPLCDGRERQLCGTLNTTVAEIGKAAYYSSRNAQMDFQVRKCDERKQSQVLVSGKTLWLGLGATDHLAGMGVLYLVAFHIHI
jgi:hypothetical protein